MMKYKKTIFIMKFNPNWEEQKTPGSVQYKQFKDRLWLIEGEGGIVFTFGKDNAPIFIS